MMPDDLKQVIEGKIDQDVGKVYASEHEKSIARYNFKKGCEFLYELFDTLTQNIEELKDGRHEEEIPDEPA